MDRASPPFDVAVIGGGPAGMMAAARAAELGVRVVLLEKNPFLGKKLLITGGGRCNILNAEWDAHLLAAKYGPKGKALLSPFARHDARSSWEFFESRGLGLMVEAEKRAFPRSQKAEDVRNLLQRAMQKHGVEVRTGVTVQGLSAEDGRVTAVRTDTGDVVATSYILATGGTSRPETGSTGDGFRWMRELGHEVADPDPALVPVTLAETWLADVAGISLRGVKLVSWSDGKRLDARVGKMLFTHEGLSGPLVLNMSKSIGEALKTGPVTLALDLFPKMDPGALDDHLLTIFEHGKNRMIKNHVGEITQPRLAHLLLRLAGIDGDTPLRQLTREQRLAFGELLKALPLRVKALMGAEKAIVAGGGVSLKDVDFKTMRSKKLANLHFAGDILDFDRPSGGFSLQICWSTGWVAGTASASG